MGGMTLREVLSATCPITITWSMRTCSTTVQIESGEQESSTGFAGSNYTTARDCATQTKTQGFLCQS
jgi:hypothetical protein